ncbi:hypothetical protein CO612_07340 [Lysobacteraceae bacterium NML71-0210]|nr:hypothetical protein CO612_07340 [Xanthomonadaceae bacterium NML71-0210]
MSVIGAAVISFLSVVLLSAHLKPHIRRRIVGYAGVLDLCVHGGVIWLFFGSSTIGLLQAELAAIFFTIYVRGYRWLRGYERLTPHGWRYYPGVM